MKINEKRIHELENQFILVYFGPRSSSKMHDVVISNYKNRDKATINSFEIMKQCAYEMKTSINSDIEILGEIINKNWEAQKSLHYLMINPLINKAEKIAKSNGAIGFKCNGAGGGGSATILAESGHESQIKKKLIENGFTILPCKLSFTGVRCYD
jgi:galactokinase/mevalonate kinase-like predicted kinase